MVGLCVGHDSLFIKFSEAPVTVLIAKDRVLAHNPVGALYCARSYYESTLIPGNLAPSSVHAPDRPPRSISVSKRLDLPKSGGVVNTVPC